jgi:hypothetical protein
VDKYTQSTVNLVISDLEIRGLSGAYCFKEGKNSYPFGLLINKIAKETSCGGRVGVK